MKIVEFPDQDEEQKKNIQEFLDEAKVTAEEEGVTDAVVIMMDSDGKIGMSIASTYLDATAMIATAFKAI